MMVMVVQMGMRVREILLGLVARFVFAALQMPLHVLHLVQHFAVLLAVLRTLSLQFGQVLLAGFVVLRELFNCTSRRGIKLN